MPADLRAAIEANPKARKTFETLGRGNLFALAFRTSQMRTPNGRARKIETLVAMLARGETIMPQKAAQVPRAPARASGRPIKIESRRARPHANAGAGNKRESAGCSLNSTAREGLMKCPRWMGRARRAERKRRDVDVCPSSAASGWTAVLEKMRLCDRELEQDARATATNASPPPPIAAAPRLERVPIPARARVAIGRKAGWKIWGTSSTEGVSPSSMVGVAARAIDAPLPA